MGGEGGGGADKAGYAGDLAGGKDGRRGAEKVENVGSERAGGACEDLY